MRLEGLRLCRGGIRSLLASGEVGRGGAGETCASDWYDSNEGDLVIMAALAFFLTFHMSLYAFSFPLFL